ncbi:NPCBM/NEW2 domain-containing protein [Saccharothrix sp. HUAS TT1]|uniref:NPCBM/NEW2 domain-containing protein n=1 Tax=unclassified Saccharothrix TaxID=2593673 RepID=UPI00345B8B51
MDDQDRDDPRDRRIAGKAVWLPVAGVAVLAAGVLIGVQLNPAPSKTEASTQVKTTSATTSTTTSAVEASIAPVRPGATWLADLAPVDSSSIDDMYVESPWTAAPATVREVTYTKAVSATGAWCRSAQLTFALDGGYERFSARVAIADNSLETKGLDFYVVVDDRRVVEIANAITEPQPVDVPVVGARLLTIGVEPPADDLSDCPGPERVGVWADPSFTTPAG